MKIGAIATLVLILLAFQFIPSQAAADSGSTKISLTPTSVGFGTMDFGATPELKTVVIKNKGQSDVVIDSIVIGGEHPEDFSQANECATVPAGGECAVDVIFAPAAVGKRNGILRISYNGTGKDVKLSGKADPIEVELAKTTGREMALSAAFDGTNYLVGIQGDGSSDTNVTAQLVSRSGALLGDRISSGESGGAPMVAFDNTNYLLVWTEDASPSGFLKGQLISPSGGLVGSPFTVASGTDIKTCRILFDGTNYLVVWDDEASPSVSSTSDIYGQFVTPSGELLGSPIPISTAPQGQRFPALASDGTNLLIVWVDARNQSACEPGGESVCFETDTFGQFVTRSSESEAGTLLGSNFEISTSSFPRTSPVTIAFDGENYFVVFSETEILPTQCSPTGCSWKITGEFVTTGGSPIETVKISKTKSDRLFPFLVFNGEYFLVSWTDHDKSTSTHIRGRFMNRIIEDPKDPAAEISAKPMSPVFLVDGVASQNNKSDIPAKSVPWAAVPLFDGTNYFWVINRAVPGKDPKDFDAYTDVDVYITIGPGPGQTE
jgi:hypothetical protein